MKVKVGDKVYTSQEQPIMVILEPQDKINIAKMAPGMTRYAEFRDDWGTREEKLAWMKEEE